MKILSYIRLMPSLLNKTLILAILSVLLMDIYLKNIPEIVPWGYKFGEVYYKLCLSFFASYIFYFIVVHIKQVEDKNNVNIFIEKQVSRIIEDYKLQINAIKKETDYIDEKLYLEISELEEIFKKINSTNNAPLILGFNKICKYANWMQYFEFHNKNTKEHIKKVFSHMLYLDSKLVKTLAHIDDCSHFSIVALLKDLHINTSFASFSSTFYEYSKLCAELEAYYQSKLINYKS